MFAAVVVADVQDKEDEHDADDKEVVLCKSTAEVVEESSEMLAEALRLRVEHREVIAQGFSTKRRLL